MKSGSAVSHYHSGSLFLLESLGEPILFLMMINDLKLSSGKTSDWKYVNDITLSELVKKMIVLKSELLVDDFSRLLRSLSIE